MSEPVGNADVSVSGNRRLYGFPEPLMELVDLGFPGNSGPCGFCGDTILGGRHRVIDAIAERFVVGDEPEDDYGISARQLAVAIAASYEHDKALKRQRRAERRAS